MRWEEYRKQQDRENRSLFLTILFSILAAGLFLAGLFTIYFMVVSGVTILNCILVIVLILGFIYCTLVALDAKKKDIRDRMFDLFAYIPWL